MNIKNVFRLKSSRIAGDFIAGDKNGLDEEMTRNLFQELISNTTSPNRHKLTDDYKKIAEDLLKSFAPHSLITLSPDVRKEKELAISFIDWESRRIMKINKQESDLDRSRSMIKIAELLSLQHKKHLIIGSGGLGKTHTLWHMANKLLVTGKALPIYISLADFNSISEVMAFFDNLIPDDGILQLKQDPNVIFFLDGWSQFPKGLSHSPEAERQKLLAILGDVRVIATGRYTTPSDSPFSIWELEGLSDTVVKAVLSIGLPNGNHHQIEQINELLRIPLLLILYLLLNGGTISKGELLSEFQRNLTPGDPHQANQLLIIMSRAVARVSLINKSRRKADFDRVVSSIVDTTNAKDIPTQINELGTLGYQQNHLKPIHDLYLEWLIGIGIIQDWGELYFRSVQDLSTREGIMLALESGEILSASHLQSIMNLDLVYTATFLPFVNAKNASERRIIKDIIKKIDNLMDSDQDYNRYRGILAALTSGSTVLFEKCLKTLSEMVDQGYYFHDLEQYLEVTFLKKNRAILADWLIEGKGIDYFLSAIMKSGDPSWIAWIKEQYDAGKLSIIQAIGTALATVSTLPIWIRNDLATMIKQRGAYHLRSAAKRGVNRELAQWVMENYAELVLPSDSTFYHLNMVLVGCGDDQLFQQMFDHFDSYPPHVQEVLLYAFRDRDESWMIKFQEKYLSTGNMDIFYLLFENVYEAITDKKAEEWTENQNEIVQTHGWKTLVKKHQNAMVLKLIENLPESFDNVSYVPALKAMQELNNAPADMVDELWKRLHGNIEPMLMQDVIYALAKVYPTGLISIVGELQDNPNFLPDYHLYLFLQLLKEWSQRGEVQLMVKTAKGEIEFIEYLLLSRLATRDSNHFFAKALKVGNSKRILDFLVPRIETGSADIYTLLIESGGTITYHPALVTYVMGFPTDQCVADMFNLFSSCWHTFPEAKLIEVLEKIIESNDKRNNLFKFINQISKHHQDTNKAIYKRILNVLFEWPEKHTHPYRDMASILANYSPDILIELLEPFLSEKKPQTLWLIRLIESNSEIKLLDEEGQWI
ncbi:hypothetical protein [Viridibacillus arvi]|uniref:hypothetical protein n=1 Tax=Viridibacillus arvi TaxID=263475 RepID=UPI0036F0C01B